MAVTIVNHVLSDDFASFPVFSRWAFSPNAGWQCIPCHFRLLLAISQSISSVETHPWYFCLSMIKRPFRKQTKHWPRWTKHLLSGFLYFNFSYSLLRKPYLAAVTDYLPVFSIRWSKDTIYIITSCRQGRFIFYNFVSTFLEYHSGTGHWMQFLFRHCESRTELGGNCWK